MLDELKSFLEDATEFAEEDTSSTISDWFDACIIFGMDSVEALEADSKSKYASGYEDALLDVLSFVEELLDGDDS